MILTLNFHNFSIAQYVKTKNVDLIYKQTDKVFK